MIDIMGGNKKAEPFRMYVDNTIRAFLAVRKYRENIINIVDLITKSSLGCFNKESITVF
jgi:phosphatidylinositol 4-kinase